jgi:hypothetical protein
VFKCERNFRTKPCHWLPSRFLHITNTNNISTSGTSIDSLTYFHWQWRKLRPHNRFGKPVSTMAFCMILVVFVLQGYLVAVKSVTMPSLPRQFQVTVAFVFVIVRVVGFIGVGLGVPTVSCRALTRRHRSESCPSESTEAVVAQVRTHIKQMGGRRCPVQLYTDLVADTKASDAMILFVCAFISSPFRQQRFPNTLQRLDGSGRAAKLHTSFLIHSNDTKPL